jgi:hypothetical protein
MSEATASKQQSEVQVSVESKTSVSTEIDKVILGGIAAFVGVIGLWSVASLMSAMFQAGGPFQLAGAYFKALAGM